MNELRNSAQERSLGEFASSFERYFGEDDIGATLPASGLRRRKRRFTPEVTFWAFLSQVLTPACACRETVRRVQLWWHSKDAKSLISEGTTAYCRARRRLALEWLYSLNEKLTFRLSREVLSDQLWCGRRVKIVDGTSASMPDTAANQQRWPQPRNQKPGCGFPVVRLVGLLCLSSGSLLKMVHGTLREAEACMARKLWTALERGDVLLGDRAHGSYIVIARLLAQGVDSVFRLSGSRKLDLSKAHRLGAGDWLVTWKRPSRSSARMEEDRQHHASFPLEMELRVLRWQVEVPGFRTQEIVLVTTLTDPETYPAHMLRELYLKRWSVELHFREIKTLLSMDVLRCKSPQTIQRELLLHQIAYNLVRCVMQEAAACHHVALQSLSFKGTLDTMRTWAAAIHAARFHHDAQSELYASMLAIIAKDTLPYRPNRSEPRAVKRRPKSYRMLTNPRHQMKIHRKRPRMSPIVSC